MEVGGVADTVVRNGRPVRGRAGPIAIVVPMTRQISVGLQDRHDGSAIAGADGERTRAGRLEALAVVALGELHDADARAKAMLVDAAGNRSRSQD